VVNVHIHQFKPGGAVVDADALAQFQEQWATYRKLIASNDLSHREVGAILHDTLKEAFASPFTFLDIACGDASMMKAALRGTKVRHYHGIDLSQPALELAAANLARCVNSAARPTSHRRARSSPIRPTSSACSASREARRGHEPRRQPLRAFAQRRGCNDVHAIGCH
jgi:hypothetical protein